MTTLASRDAIQRFCVRSLPPAEQGELRLAEPCWVRAQGIKGCRWALITRDALYLTENPPKRLSAPVPLSAITRVTIGRALPSFLPRDVAEKTQQVTLTYRAPPSGKGGGGRHAARSPLNSTSGSDARGGPPSPGGSPVTVKPEARGHSSGSPFFSSLANSGDAASSSLHSYSFDGSDPPSPLPSKAPRGSIDISAALEAANNSAHAGASGGKSRGSAASLAHSLASSRNGSVNDLRAMEDLHRLSLSPRGPADTASHSGVASAPVSPRWRRRQEAEAAAGGGSSTAASPQNTASPSSSRRGSRGLLAYFHRNNGSASSLSTSAMSAAGTVAAAEAEQPPASPTTPDKHSPRSPSPTQGASVEMSLFTMQTHTQLHPCLQESWRCALVRETLHGAGAKDREASAAVEGQLRRALRTALSSSSTVEARTPALERCCSLLKAHLPCCRLFLRDPELVVAALHQANQLLTFGRGVGGASAADSLELALLWLDVLVQSGRGGVNLAERRGLIAGPAREPLLKLIATLCRPPAVPACPPDEAANLDDVARDIASGALELFGVVCNVCEGIGQDTSDSSGVDLGDSGDGDMLSSKTAGGSGPTAAPASGGGHTAPLSRREVLSAMCREPALEMHVLKRVVQSVAKALCGGKGAAVKPRRLVRLHFYLALLEHMLDHGSPLRNMILRNYRRDLLHALTSAEVHASIANELPLAVVVYAQVADVAALLA